MLIPRIYKRPQFLTLLAKNVVEDKWTSNVCSSFFLFYRKIRIIQFLHRDEFSLAAISGRFTCL